MTCVRVGINRILFGLAILIVGANVCAADPPEVEQLDRKYKIRRVGPDWGVPSPSASPAPTRAPAAEPAPRPSPLASPSPVPISQFSNLTFGAAMSYADMTLVDRASGGRARLVSGLSFDSRVQWHHIWSRNW